MADGHIPVKSHDSQENAVSPTQENKEEHLGATASKGDGRLPPIQEVGQGQGGDDRRVADLQHCQVGQEEVHGGVEGAVGADNDCNGGIATEAE